MTTFRGASIITALLPLLAMPAAERGPTFGPAGLPPLEPEPGRKAARAVPRLNRSQHWGPAETYAEARFLSPFPDRPVR